MVEDTADSPSNGLKTVCMGINGAGTPLRSVRAVCGTGLASWLWRGEGRKPRKMALALVKG